MYHEKKRSFLGEFKTFIARGNVLDLAVGVIIGGAFSAITTSLVNDIINPILGIFTGGGDALSALAFPLPGGSQLMLGNFINAVLNFLIMAFVLFCLLKAVNKLASLGHKKEAAAAPATKKCPYCMSEIPIAAVRCPHCTSHLMEEQNKNS